MEAAALIIALAGVFAVLSSRALAAGATLSINAVRSLAESTVARDFPEVDPLMLRAMAEIESSRSPSAVRVESHINDASVGLMQTLIGTAQWLARDMGATRFGIPNAEDLLRPEVSMYFGAAMVNWLRNWKRVTRDEEWIVRSYNGGPGAFNAQTDRHFERYKAAKARLLGA